MKFKLDLMRFYVIFSELLISYLELVIGLYMMCVFFGLVVIFLIICNVCLFKSCDKSKLIYMLNC